MNLERYSATILLSVITTLSVSVTAFEPPLGERTIEQAAGDSLVMALLQDEPEWGEIPAENRISYTPSRNEVGIQLDAYGMTGVEFEDVEFLVIGPKLEKSTYKPDREGLVIVEDVTPGPHVLVALGEHYHGAQLLFLEEDAEKPAADDGQDPPGKANSELLEVARMTILEVARKDVASFVDRTRGLRHGRLPQSVRTGARHGYRVPLRPDGTIHGRLISVRESNVPKNLAGSTIGIFRDGDLVAVTRSDEQGFWQVPDLKPGLYGLIAAGAEGYVAFAFKVTADDGVAQHGKRERFVSILQTGRRVLPCVLIPPMFLPEVSETIDSFYESQEILRPELIPQEVLPGERTGIPVRTALIPPIPIPISGSGGAGGGTAAGATGGAGLGGTGAIAAALAAAATSVGSDDLILVPEAASPSQP